MSYILIVKYVILNIHHISEFLTPVLRDDDCLFNKILLQKVYRLLYSINLEIQ